MPPKRVLYVIDNLGAGGIEHQTVELAKGLDYTRYTPEFLCFYGARAGRSTQFYDVLHAAGIPVTMLDLTMNPLAKARAWLEIVRTAWSSDADIVHSVNYHGNILLGYARPLMRPKTRTVVSVRFNNTRKQMRNQRLSWRLTSAIITNGAHLKQELVKEAGLPDDKITIIPNGLNVHRFREPGEPTFRDQFDADYIILMVARLYPAKSPQTLVEAVGILAQRDELNPRTRLLIVGEHEHAATVNEINSLVDEHGLHNIVQFLPETNEIEKLYHAADVTVLPSLREGIPNVMLESLAAGRPVIISEAANQAGVVQHGVNGWIFRTQDAAHLAETLQRFFALPDEERTTIQTVCRDSIADFAMEKMIERHQQVYDAVLSSRS